METQCTRVRPRFASHTSEDEFLDAVESMQELDEYELRSSDCPICGDRIPDDERASPDGCDHVFCIRCLYKWKQRSYACPYCRADFKNIEAVGPSPPRRLVELQPEHEQQQWQWAEKAVLAVGVVAVGIGAVVLGVLGGKRNNNRR